jgi:hypothetical protein
MVARLLVCKGKMDIDRLIWLELKEKSSQGKGRAEPKKKQTQLKVHSHLMSGTLRLSLLPPC